MYIKAFWDLSWTFYGFKFNKRLIGSTLNKSGAERVQHPNLGIDTESFGVYPKSLSSTPKIKSQHLNLEVDTESFGVYPESLRVNPQILSVNNFCGQSSNLMVNYQIDG